MRRMGKRHPRYLRFGAAAVIMLATMAGGGGAVAQAAADPTCVQVAGYWIACV